MSRSILSVFGTRPEAIKMAPVVRALEADSRFRSRVCITGQHREMLDQVLRIFKITADIDLAVMKPNQALSDVTSTILLGVDRVLKQEKPDLVLVQGDTTTCFAAALAAFYNNIPLGHVEAGLRTWDLQAPFPEEGNRQIVSRLAALHFAPTTRSRDNLAAEGVRPENITVTGNTVIDALLLASDMLSDYPEAFFEGEIGSGLYWRIKEAAHPVILITGHRRENFGTNFQDLCRAIRDLSLRHQQWIFVYPVHLNPNVRDPVFSILGGLDNVYLLDPLDYMPFVWLMRHAELILTDSGGIQEEAPSLGKPVLVMRTVTERPEAVEAGTVRLVGTDPSSIMSNVEQILGDRELYASMARAHNPYGDGQATERIVGAISRFLETR
jgi:UDP-N-acetylglucosamine 2-epimerase (non-hydrolysing)